MPFPESMISILKSNKSIMLDKSKRFRKTLSGYGQMDRDEFDFPETTPEVLRNIRERLQKERRQLLWKRSLLFGIIVIILFLILY